ncbi:MAG: hypothetical protein RIB47_06470 [Cyclobacteriaceae bacterium]
MSHKIFTSLLILASLFAVRCTKESKSGLSQGTTAEEMAIQFVNAFYSFDEDSLKSVLRHAAESQPGILYYQKWAQCGNYQVVQRNDFVVKNDSLLICPVTVKDDLIGALAIDFNVTDSFHVKVIKGQIRSVYTSSNDPDLYFEAKDWVRQNRPDLIDKSCEGIWEDGTTPCECVKGMVAGFRAFNSTR